MAQEAYTALYSARLRDFLQAVDDKTLRTFLGLAAHADARGVCFPGVRELAQICAIPIASVLEGLFTLNELGMVTYLRRDQHDPITRRQLPNVYALNPGLLRISEPLEGVEFIAGANITKKPDRYYPSPPIHKQNQEAESSSRFRNQLQEATPDRSSKPTREGHKTDHGAASLHESGAEPADGDANQQNTAGAENTARNATQNGKSAAARREPRSLQAYKAPLAHADTEALALRLMTAGEPNLTLENARMFVDIYGMAIVRDALWEFGQQTNLKNPGGWLRKMIRNLDAQQSIGGDADV